jgi:hypothetical protein
LHPCTIPDSRSLRDTAPIVAHERRPQVGEPPTFRRKPVGQRNCNPKWSSIHAHYAGHAQASTGYRPELGLRAGCLWLPRCPATACSGCAAAACFAARNGWVDADGVLTRLATDADTRLRNQNQPSTSTSESVGGLGIGRVPKAIGTPSSARLERWFHSPTLWPEAEVRILPMSTVTLHLRRIGFLCAGGNAGTTQPRTPRHSHRWAPT